MAKRITLDDIPPKFRTDNEFRLHPAKVPHVVLEPDFVADKRVFVIGDVHGCCDELKLLIDKAGITIGDPDSIIILVGDLINKGPKNKEVLEFVRQLGAFSVRGNHDQKCISQMAFLREGKPIEEEFEYLREMSDEDFDQLIDLPYTISLPSLKSVIVHAGLVPGLPLASQDAVEMIIMRNLIEDTANDHTESDYQERRYKATKSRKVGQPWASVWPGPDHVYFGHDAVRGLQQYDYATGLDTGCVYGKRLTGIFLTGDKQLVEVKAAKMYSVPDL
ncbi:bis(5'-nucleosyl)-tetraphosphatase PrpE [asymmetrical]-like [Asterias rubens]|uniref:bis(5'-nucleosyl)-tetraphosphatase PrpE [asymmetrical]-like n=1 Tax=Asterias rubens TaxID=7604 RepID=UPI001455C0F2|nr:bis(5'-nucleosyl)-tetraphosphatase PrpE [asymmetrical]-like [Asterias rubens]XP_033627453.1 bis(5'-nucleosyl)-tetraphosphatase PrpE [asymmetrical]-like [Asterias rubens]XP_033627454.1 bis(5'-nucleosyl)-tetraphosphatase PrpE [asymmetrical]-like [Asterias rubens]XP_033627455.1 bis(5'-nucleosyl)-tetraphosphatase PrpE [asymmetrical]-like [Asterias rubens]